jgi:predicted kinase
MTTVIAVQGYPGCGKTTFCKAWVRESPETRARVSRDDIRSAQFASEGILPQDQENLVTKLLNMHLVALIRAGKDVIVDNTNLRARNVKELAALANKEGADFKTFAIDTDVEECIARDDMRGLRGERCVGEEVIRNFAKKFPRKNWPVVNSPITSNASQVKKYTGTPGKRRAWILDVDGTIAKMVDRGPHDTSKYYTDVRNEPVHQAVLALYNAGLDIVVTSGRSEDFRNETYDWLWANDVPFAKLIMRKSGDIRNDAIVKEELFWEQIADNWDVQGCLDDRNRVVDKWREMGLTCFQVAPGNF